MVIFPNDLPRRILASREVKYVVEQTEYLSEEEKKRIDDKVVFPARVFSQTDSVVLNHIQRFGEEGDIGEDGVEMSSESVHILGSYEKISSPGKIELYEKNLTAFFWGIVYQLDQKNYRFTAYELSRVADATVYKTYFHERFHYRCDLARILFSGAPNRKQEEGLAVAYSRVKVERSGGGWKSSWDKVPLALRKEFLDIAYVYNNPVYDAWKSYWSEEGFDKEKFDLALVNHLLNHTSLKIMKNAGGKPDSWFKGAFMQFFDDLPEDMCVESYAIDAT